jgi:hypothetical protein
MPFVELGAFNLKLFFFLSTVIVLAILIRALTKQILEISVYVR